MLLFLDIERHFTSSICIAEKRENGTLQLVFYLNSNIMPSEFSMPFKKVISHYDGHPFPFQVAG